MKIIIRRVAGQSFSFLAIKESYLCGFEDDDFLGVDDEE